MALEATPAPPLSREQIDELEPALRAYAIRAVGDRDLARDLVQDTLLAVVAGRAPFEGRSRLRTWAIGILAHKIMDWFRARRSASLDDLAPDDLAEPIERRPDRVVARREALAVLDAALRELPELERFAILLIDVEGIERDAACDHLGVTAAHLRVLLHRGRHRLRRALEAAGAGANHG
jgi:RNA polymerase sigma-70 factor (ECF subfamily)